jgi:hypothetical protein
MSATYERFAVEVIADSSEEWVGNAIRFATQAEAEEYAKDLWSRWTAVRSWRVVETIVAGWFMFKTVSKVAA